MVAYSMDLRERVVAAVKTEGLSRRAAAARFGVSYSAAIEWLKLFDETGSVAPRQVGGYKPRKISGTFRDWLVGLRPSHGSATIQFRDLPSSVRSPRGAGFR